MTKLLIVEDNPDFRKGAEKYFRSQNTEPDFTIDYDETMESLPHYRQAIIDCFFPKKAGSNDISLGLQAVEKMEMSDPDARKMKEGLKVFGQYVDLSDSDMNKYARNLINNSGVEDISQNPIVRALKQVSILGKEATTLIAKNSLSMVYREEREQRRDYYTALREAMKELESNQPLGILVAEEAEDLKIPFILATSTYHHDILTQPIQNYAGRKGWHLLDCYQGKENEKATPEFWERAHEALKQRS